MELILFVLLSGCVTAQKTSGDDTLISACVNLCEQQEQGVGCDELLSGTDCDQSCQGIVAAIPDECDPVTIEAWNCLSNLDWECTEGASPEITDTSCEEAQINYLNCVEIGDTGG